MAYDVEDNKNDAFDDVVRQARQNSSAGAAGGRERPEGVTDLKIILWGNGFQVGGDDAPFRNLNDESNKQFIEELKQGVVPQEIRSKYPRGVEVGLEDRRS